MACNILMDLIPGLVILAVCTCLLSAYNRLHTGRRACSVTPVCKVVQEATLHMPICLEKQQRGDEVLSFELVDLKIIKITTAV